MHKKSIYLLVLVTFFIVVVALVATNQRNTAATNQLEGQLFYPELETKINEVVVMEVSDGENTTSIEKKGDIWAVKEKNNYHAAVEKIKETIVKLSKFKIIEGKTRKPESYKVLGVQDPTVEGSASKIIKLMDKDGTILAETIIGNIKYGRGGESGKNSVYVRKPADDQAWLVVGDLTLDADSKSWINTEILDVKKDRIKRVAITQADNKVLVVEKDALESKDYKIKDLPNKSEPKSQSVVNSIAAALENLKLEDVLPQEEFDFSNTENIIGKYSAYDGLVVSTLITKKDDKWYLKLKTTFDDALISKPDEVVNSSNDIKLDVQNNDKSASGQQEELNQPTDAPTTDALTSNIVQKGPDEVRKEVSELNEYLDKWIFIIQNYSATNLTKNIDEIVDKKS